MRGSDSWVWERWSRVSTQDAAAMRAQFEGDNAFEGAELCETCRARNERETTAEKPVEVRADFEALIDYWRRTFGDARKAANVSIRSALRVYPWLRAHGLPDFPK